jgi:hypothetical protein
MYSVRRTAVLPAVGFPIRVSADHRPFSASSRLIAAVHALLRLLVPRHPPCALDILTVILIDLAVALPKECPLYATHDAEAEGFRRGGIRLLDDCAVFKVRTRGRRPGIPAVGLSKLNSMQAPMGSPAGSARGAAPSAGASAPRPARSTLGTCSSESTDAVLRLVVSRQALQSWSSLERR